MVVHCNLSFVVGEVEHSPQVESVVAGVGFDGEAVEGEMVGLELEREIEVVSPSAHGLSREGEHEIEV